MALRQKPRGINMLFGNPVGIHVNLAGHRVGLRGRSDDLFDALSDLNLQPLHVTHVRESCKLYGGGQLFAGVG
jgi:hypothetical protein